MEVPLSRPDITEREIELVNQVLRTPFLSMGPMLRRFEEDFARFIGTKEAVAISSGTAGLHLCVVAAGIGPGDEVITTPFSFVASANCVLYTGARPVFVDVEEGSWNMDPERVEAAITPRTRAILAVHIFGQPCRMDRLLEIARRHDLLVLEDACEAVGAEFQGRKVGTFGRAAVFAFYPNKQMTTGEGGIITTDDPGWAALLRSLRNQGREAEDLWLHHPRLGFNYRLNEMSCALGVAQLERIEELLTKRERVAQEYTRRLRDVSGVAVLEPSAQTTRMSWFLYPVRLLAGPPRARVMEELARRGVPTRPYFSAIHLQPFYRERFGSKEGDFPVTEAAASSMVALPFYGKMTDQEIEHVCHTLAEVLLRL
ncbi:MAG: DegT/DnrJ/EryC1/StrS family aminotransferase [Chloroflexi bacterium]|nr:DegT/DnrJ/EryC1/StrS family aminotransferase [Chloroflexota bacterium]